MNKQLEEIRDELAKKMVGYHNSSIEERLASDFGFRNGFNACYELLRCKTCRYYSEFHLFSEMEIRCLKPDIHLATSVQPFGCNQWVKKD